MLRVASAAFCGLFLLSVAVQWNDPDPAFWMVSYALAAVLAGLGAAGRFPLWPNLAALVLFTALFAAWSPTLLGAREEAFTSFAMRAPDDEEPREAVGLAVCAAWSAVQSAVAVRRRRAGRRRG